MGDVPEALRDGPLAGPDRAGPLVDLLRAVPADIGVHDALVAARAREAVPELLRLLGEDLPRKDRLVRTIAAIGGDEAWQGLIARLGDPTLRTAVELALGRSAPPEVIDALKRQLLPARDPAARASGVRILAVTADPRHGGDVRALLDGETEWEVRHAGIGALGRLGDKACADALLDLARHGGREARAAALALTGIRDAATLEHAAARWPELGGEARAALLRAPGGLGAPGRALLAAAREALHDPDDLVRLAAIDLLSRAGDASVEPLLDHALRRARTPEAEIAVRALAGLATPRAAEAGLRALEAVPPRRQERYRAAFLATLSR